MFLGCWIDNFAEHEYGIRVSLYNSKEERPVDHDFVGIPSICSSVLNLRSSLCHLKHNFVEDLWDKGGTQPTDYCCNLVSVMKRTI